MQQLKKHGHTKEAAQLRKHLLHLPSVDPNDDEYRRLRYVRYADDFLLGFSGPLVEAEEIRQQLKEFLHDTLKLELSQEKTLITHAQTSTARFLGYEIAVQHSNEKLDQTKRRVINGVVELRVPREVIEKTVAKYQRNGKPIHLGKYIRESDFAIVEKFQWKYRGLMQYYALAVNIAWLSRVHWVMQTSLLKTLANKHKSSVAHMIKQYQAEIETPYGKMKCLEVKIEREGKKPLIARFGGIPWRRQEKARLSDLNLDLEIPPRKEVVKRLLRNTCELCGSREEIQVHHIRALKDLKEKGRKEKPLWVQVMASLQRKTLVVCKDCHQAIHAGRPTRQPPPEQQ